VLKTLFQEMSKNLPSGWELTLEVTHHGPFIEKPCCFIEIGSNEEDWRKKEAGKALAIAIENAIKILNKQKIKYKTVIGIGGPHYCPSMTKIQLNSDIAISHIIPQYVFPITENMISQALKKTEEKVSFAIIDWKGLDSEERKQTIDLLNKINLEYKKTSEIEK
ncbi:hypothetical protein COY61_01590, partial [bacterium (Candidatus Gribaldobacteria) CG_4_10_14_0_8_um_filter_33_9]